MPGSVGFWIALLLFFASAPACLPEARAAGKKPSPGISPPQNKKKLRWAPMDDIRIELPGQSFFHFKPRFEAVILGRLIESGNYEVTESVVPGPSPGVSLKVRVDALNFSTGSRGQEMFYGFDERFRTPFNDGSSILPNEFPLRLDTSEAGWFGDIFGPKGSVLWGSLSGLDVGEEVQLSAAVAWMRFRYARYHAELHIDVILEGGAVERQRIEVQGNGFYFDVSGGYVVYTGGLALARRDAIQQAVTQVIDKAYDGINEAVLSPIVPARVPSFQAETLLRDLEATVSLPYRVWRYFKYDQDYHSKPDGAIFPPDFKEKMTREPWMRQIGLIEATREADPVVVAVIDSGIDYNHPLLHDFLWVNPAPTQDPKGRLDRYGWDYISNDPRPYDDGYHGTQLASLVVAVAPNVKLLPLKVFNPWGVTTSAAIYAAFVYAVDHHAQVILCGWATPVASQALERGVAYAQEHGVGVVVAAGDEGKDLAQEPRYPASFARNYPNVLAVASVDDSDQLAQQEGRASNYDPETVRIAAPGEGIWVAEPRVGLARESSSGLAAALVAGALARILPSLEKKGSSPLAGIDQLIQNADVIPELSTAVRGGARLRTR